MGQQRQKGRAAPGGLALDQIAASQELEMILDECGPFFGRRDQRFGAVFKGAVGLVEAPDHRSAWMAALSIACFSVIFSIGPPLKNSYSILAEEAAADGLVEGNIGPAEDNVRDPREVLCQKRHSAGAARVASRSIFIE